MNDTNLGSRYLFNEIPDDQKTLDEFGYKACNLSLAKKWQFPCLLYTSDAADED